MGFFNNLNDKLQNFMVGRNGSDRLARWAIGAAIVFIAINFLFNNIVVLAISYALLFYSFFRVFSKDTAAREREDERFSELLDKAAFWRRDRSSSSEPRRSSESGSGSARGSHSSGREEAGRRAEGSRAGQTESFRSKYGSSSSDHPRQGGSAAGESAARSDKIKVACEACGQSLSVPKGRGTLQVTCPKCHHKMKVKS